MINQTSGNMSYFRTGDIPDTPDLIRTDVFSFKGKND
jgi:hypothetical protein